MKKILFLLCFGLFWFIFNKPTLGQKGTFKCASIPNTEACVLVDRETKCDSDYKPGDCSIWRGRQNKRECEQPHQCIPKSLASACTTRLWTSCPQDFPHECRIEYQCCKEAKDCEELENLFPVVTIDPTCRFGDDPTGGINTALGCIPARDLNEFVKWVLGKVIFVASGIAFLLMVLGALQILTSAGNPEKVKAGSELITSALSGLLFIILSLFLLKLIGVDILHIPGFG